MRQKFDYDFLVKHCESNNITLLEDYSNEKVTMLTIIKGTCMNSCEDSFEKSFRRLVSHGGYCPKCKEIVKQKIYQQTCLEKYGVENAFQSNVIKEKIKKDNMEKHGVEFTTQLTETKEKIKKTNMEKYGVEYPIQLKEIMDKAIKTNMEKYGVEHPGQSNEIMDKIKKTNLEKYGNVCSLHGREQKEKNLEKYGVDVYGKTKECHQKKKNTCLEKYGKDNYFKTDEFKIKLKEINNEKYGVDYAMQNAEVANKSSKNSYLSKEYTFPSGNKINVQGYECFALDKLIKEEKINEADILTSRIDVPEIWYCDELNHRHRHFVDIYVKSQKRCIEVKSEWTFNKNKEKVLLKQKSAKDLGYKYDIWIFNNKGVITKQHN